MDSSCFEESSTLQEDEQKDEIPASSSQNTVEFDENSEVKDDLNDACQKPTFKNALQAKKRLQAFAQQKQILISPSAKIKPMSNNEKSPCGPCESQEFSFSVKPKKENPLDKAKATIEEIELLKKLEFSNLIPVSKDDKRTRRSRSKSSERNFVFRKRERKVRNYRRSDTARRSPSPMITTARDKHSEKSKNKYPRNWEEFTKDNWTFEKLTLKDSHFKSRSSNAPHDIFRHLQFDSPANIIKPYHFKNERGAEIAVPFKFLRYTLTKPKISFNENVSSVKGGFLNRKQVLERTSKGNRAILEKFYSRTTKKFKTSEPLGQRNWYLKNWRDSDSKMQETSIGLSFLQTYSDDDEEEEQVLETPIESNKTKEEDLTQETKSETVPMENRDYELSQIVGQKTDNISKKEEDEKEPDEEESTPSDCEKRNRRKSESTNDNIGVEENVSWTPEKKVLPSEDMWQESPKIDEEKLTPENIKEKTENDKNLESVSEKDKSKIPSDDEWAETPERKVQDSDIEKKKKKKSKQRNDSDSESEVKKLKKKRKKLDRKKKQREKEKKARKKEKLKAEKLKKEKKKQKEKEKEKKKEILKKLKKEFRQNLEEKKRKTSNAESMPEIPVKVKIEKEDKYEQVIKPVEDLRKFLNQKERNNRESVETIDDKKDLKNNQVVELLSVEVKKEKIVEDENIQNCSNKEEAKVEESKVEETFKDHKKTEDEAIISNLEEKHPVKSKSKRKRKKEEEEEEVVGEVTPDTEEYQSNWESDDGISPIVKPESKKSSRGWESDEEVFERGFSKKETVAVPFRASPILEMPLDIKKFSRRSFNRPEKKRSRTRSPEYLDMAKEIKLLEAERINLNKERMQLEIEKIRIHELERKNSLEDMSREELSPVWHKNQQNREKWHTKDDSIDSTSRDNRERVQHSKNKDKSNETASTSINSSKSNSSVILSIHSSPEITSTKSPKHTGLETAYQEFMRAVSGGTETKEDIVISSTESEMPYQPETSNRSKVKYSRSRRDRRKERSVEIVEEEQEQKVLSTTDPKILQEILLPDEIPLPEIPVPFPVPVPSPKLDLSQNVLSTSGNSSIQTTAVQSPTVEPKSVQESSDNQQYSSENSTPRRPLTFSTLVIPSKKPVLLERSNWKLDDDSDEELPSSRKKLDNIEMIQEQFPEEVVKDWSEENSTEKGKIVEKKEDVEKHQQHVEDKVREKRVKEKEHDRSVKRRHSRSRSPPNASRDKRRREEDTRRKEDTRRREEDTRRREEETRRNQEDEIRRREEDTRRREEDTRRREEDTRRREDEIRRREDARRRDSGSRRGDETRRREEEEAKRRERNKRPNSPRHREPSPRRRRFSSPIHRRSSPKNRSPPRRVESSRKPDRSDRRSPQRSPTNKRRRSYSPAKPSLATRRRSPSPRDAPQYSRMSKSPRRSPMEGLKRSVADSTISDDLLPQPYPMDSSSSPLCSSTPAPPSRRSRLNLSPKRPSLDERINQVLGIENQPQPLPSWKSSDAQGDPRQNVSYPGYHHHKAESDLGFPSAAPSTSSKVLQVGNNLQVVPSEDLCAIPIPQPVQAPAVQKIVQVGNMLQIVPSDMVPIIPPPPPPEPVVEAPALVEKNLVVTAIPDRKSAEDVLAGRMAERERKKKEKEDRKKEKEKKKKEKDKKRKMRLKVSTEEMIKRALELDGYIGADNEDLSSLVPEVINDTPGLDPSRSILSSSTSRFSESIVKTERERKSVQFADGVRPGEGTSPSGGEELSSPPPQNDVLVKSKKYKRLGSIKKKKRKIKVKVVKKRPVTPLPTNDSDEEYENLPPPSPPPGSPPPHVFPVRAKVHTINNIPQHYLPAYGITTAPQTPPVVQPQTRMSLAFQTPPTAMYRTPPPHVVGQHYPRISHAPPMGMNVPPPSTSMHRDQQSYGSF